MQYDDEVRLAALELLAGGCSAREVGRRLGVSDWAVGSWASLAGMVLRFRVGNGGGLDRPWPPEPSRGYRLGLAQRVQIGCRLEAGWSMRRIAAVVGVAPSTVCREVARGTRLGRYDPGWSQRRAELAGRRPRPGKLGPGTRLRSVVVAGLNARHSPQQIAGRLARLARLARLCPGRHDQRVSHETIYQALYVQGRGALREELRVEKALRSGRTGRRPVSKLPARSNKPWLAGAHISTRPAAAKDRAVPGHWEGDLVVGARSRSALITLVERASRFCLISRLPDLRDSDTVADRLITMITALPAVLGQPPQRPTGDGNSDHNNGVCQTLAWDQGSEMAQHHRFSIATGCQVFFCDPHSPWQRGSNENLNGLIRDFYPKGTNFADITDTDIAHTQRLLNTRPRMTLDWATPRERLTELLALR